MKTNDTYRVLKNLLFGGTVLAAFALWHLTLFGQVSSTPTDIGYINSSQGGVTVGSTDTSLTQINISGDRAYINWRDFGIGHENYAASGNFTFTGTDSNGIVLNHVTGGSATTINGLLSSNGNVYVINKNGLTIGPNGVINTQGFVGTTFDLDTTNGKLTNFLNSTGDKLDLYFTQDGNKQVLIKKGASINIVDGLGNPVEGNIVLMGPDVEVNGTLKAEKGSVILSAETGVVHNLPSHPAIQVKGNIASTNGNAYGLAINNGGMIRANAIQITASGNVKLINANIAAMGDSAKNNIDIKSTAGNITIDSSVIATKNANINVTAENGDINFGISNDPTISSTQRNTLVNAYGTGNVNVTGKNIKLAANKADTYISIGSNHGKTNVTAGDLKTTTGDLTLDASNGGYVQVGYHFRDTDSRVYSVAANATSLFSGFNPNDPNRMKDLANLYVPTGDITVTVGRDLKINAYNSPDFIGFVPAAHIGNAYLASNLNTGGTITQYNDNGGSLRNLLSGDMKVTVGRDARITSEGASIARIGHNVRNFVYLSGSKYDSDDRRLYRVNQVRGNIDLRAKNDIVIKAEKGGTSGVGHVGDEFFQGYMQLKDQDIEVDVYCTTAGRDTILEANGSRKIGNKEWHSIAQIGTNLMGIDAAGTVETDFNYESKYRSNSVQANILAITGRDMVMSGMNGSVAVIGHENNSRQWLDSINRAKDYYYGDVIVGFGFNWYEFMDTDKLRNKGVQAMLGYYELLREYFDAPIEKEHGYLVMDAQSRIGRGYWNTVRTDIGNATAIFGFRVLADGTNAMKLANGAQIGTGIIDTSLAAGIRHPGDDMHDQTKFKYNLGPYPGAGVNIEYGYVEYDWTDCSYYTEQYGYTFADFLTGEYADFLTRDRDFNGSNYLYNLFDSVFGPIPDSDSGEVGKSTRKRDNVTMIFYPSYDKLGRFDDEIKPKPTPDRWEKSYFPWLPGWAVPCGCKPRCCKPRCCNPCKPQCNPCADPCCKVRTTCESYVPNVDDDVEYDEQQGPTLAPPRQENDMYRLPVPAITT